MQLEQRSASRQVVEAECYELPPSQVRTVQTNQTTRTQEAVAVWVQCVGNQQLVEKSNSNAAVASGRPAVHRTLGLGTGNVLSAAQGKEILPVVVLGTVMELPLEMGKLVEHFHLLVAHMDRLVHMEVAVQQMAAGMHHPRRQVVVWGNLQAVVVVVAGIQGCMVVVLNRVLVVVGTHHLWGWLAVGKPDLLVVGKLGLQAAGRDKDSVAQDMVFQTFY